MQHEVKTQAHEMKSVTQTTCCIVGGGPAGAVLALLLARKGVEVMLLEAHMDFEREFRGDTIHASVMEIMDEIGLADRLLQIRHEEAVDDEARRVLCEDRRLAETPREGEERVDRRLVRHDRLDDLDELHERHGIEEMQPGDLLRALRRGRHLDDA